MIAFDTNLLVRALVADHDDQVAVVRQLIASDTIFLSRTVLLELTRMSRSPADLAWSAIRPPGGARGCMQLRT